MTLHSVMGFEPFEIHYEARTALGPGRPFMSRGCGLATDQKAVRRRGPGRVVLGSKPQLATTEKLVSWAPCASAKDTRYCSNGRSSRVTCEIAWYGGAYVGLWLRSGGCARGLRRTLGRPLRASAGGRLRGRSGAAGRAARGR